MSLSTAAVKSLIKKYKHCIRVEPGMEKAVLDLQKMVFGCVYIEIVPIGPRTLIHFWLIREANFARHKREFQLFVCWSHEDGEWGVFYQSGNDVLYAHSFDEAVTIAKQIAQSACLEELTADIVLDSSFLYRDSLVPTDLELEIYVMEELRTKK